MFKRKIDTNGRVTLPVELIEKFNIKKEDMLDISSSDTHILIKKYQPEFVCVITGKITDKGHTIGNSFISNEGLELIEKVLKEKEGL